MRRLTALIKTIVPFPAEIQDKFFKIMKVMDLMPDEWIPDDLPTGTQIFVEEGFLLLTIYDEKQWRCTNFYIEGTATGTSSKGAAEMKEGSYRVRATEPTRIYYLTPEDAHQMGAIFPDYQIARAVLQQRSFLKSEQRKQLFSIPPIDRIISVDKFFSVLLRAPLADLTEFLRLEKEFDKSVLDAVQKRRLSADNQAARRVN